VKAFQLSDRPNHIEFVNYERESEEKILEKVLDRLRQNKEISISEKRVGPSEDIYNCELNEEQFKLLLDINYGVSIYASDESTISNLLEYFNN